VEGEVPPGVDGPFAGPGPVAGVEPIGLPEVPGTLPDPGGEGALVPPGAVDVPEEGLPLPGAPEAPVWPGGAEPGAPGLPEGLPVPGLEPGALGAAGLPDTLGDVEPDGLGLPEGEIGADGEDPLPVGLAPVEPEPLPGSPEAPGAGPPEVGEPVPVGALPAEELAGLPGDALPSAGLSGLGPIEDCGVIGPGVPPAGAEEPGAGAELPGAPVAPGGLPVAGAPTLGAEVPSPFGVAPGSTGAPCALVARTPMPMAAAPTAIPAAMAEPAPPGPEGTLGDLEAGTALEPDVGEVPGPDVVGEPPEIGEEEAGGVLVAGADVPGTGIVWEYGETLAGLVPPVVPLVGLVGEVGAMGPFAPEGAAPLPVPGEVPGDPSALVASTPMPTAAAPTAIPAAMAPAAPLPPVGAWGVAGLVVAGAPWPPAPPLGVPAALGLVGDPLPPGKLGDECGDAAVPPSEPLPGVAAAGPDPAGVLGTGPAEEPDDGTPGLPGPEDGAGGPPGPVPLVAPVGVVVPVPVPGDPCALVASTPMPMAAAPTAIPAAMAPAAPLPPVGTWGVAGLVVAGAPWPLAPPLGVPAALEVGDPLPPGRLGEEDGMAPGEPLPGVAGTVPGPVGAGDVETGPDEVPTDGAPELPDPDDGAVGPPGLVPVSAEPAGALPVVGLVGDGPVPGDPWALVASTPMPMAAAPTAIPAAMAPAAPLSPVGTCGTPPGGPALGEPGAP
jgi:hypothetical protein